MKSREPRTASPRRARTITTPRRTTTRRVRVSRQSFPRSCLDSKRSRTSRRWKVRRRRQRSTQTRYGIQRSRKLETARTAHRAVIARLAAWLQAASLFTLEEIDELRNSGFFNAEFFHTRMIGIDTGKPRRMDPRCWRCCGGTRANLRLDLNQTSLQFVESGPHRRELGTKIRVIRVRWFSRVGRAGTNSPRNSFCN